MHLRTLDVPIGGLHSALAEAHRKREDERVRLSLQPGTHRLDGIPLAIRMGHIELTGAANSTVTVSGGLLVTRWHFDEARSTAAPGPHGGESRLR